MSANVGVDLRNVQETVEDSTKEASKLVHKAVLASLGMVGFAYDGAVAVWHGTVEFVGKAEKRGEKMEAEFNQEVQKVQDQVTGEIKHRREQVEGTLNGVTKEVKSAGKSVEDRVQKTFSSLKFGDGKTVEAGQIKIEVEIKDLPIVNYDEMNAQAIIDLLSGYDAEGLAKIRDFEIAHKNRVTVLREIDERLKAMTEPAPAA